MKKKVVLWAIVLALCLLLLPEAALATVVDSGTCGDNVTWTLDSSGTLTISGTGNMWNWYYMKEAVNTPAPWYDNRSNISTVVIEPGITNIGDFAFYDCPNMDSITIPDSTTEIGINTFESSGLKSVEIPNSVSKIGKCSFMSCYNLISVSLPDSVSKIGDFSFRSCTSLTSITIPNGVTTIGNQMFLNCSSLSSITIPVSVTTIEWEAFSRCYKLTDVYYGGTETDRNNMKISTIDNNRLLHATWHYNNENSGTKPSLLNLTVSGNTATVYYQYEGENAMIFVAVYEESSGRMITCSGSNISSEDHGVADVQLKDFVPEKYKASAFLLEKGTMMPLCKKCEFVPEP